MERMPLTASGKIDRRSLPAPQRAQLEADDRQVAPSDPEKEVVAAIWSHALALERVGMQDNFFDLGGHSLLLMQVQRRLRGLLEREVSIMDLFRFPTVAALGRHLRERANGQAEPAREEAAAGRLQRDRQRVDRLRQRQRPQA
jgi:hypothetical protein